MDHVKLVRLTIGQKMAQNNKKPFNKTDPNQSKDKNPMLDYLKYSGLAFQMLAVIGVSVWAGIKLDEKFNNNNPLFVLILTFLGIFGTIYTLYSSLPKD